MPAPGCFRFHRKRRFGKYRPRSKKRTRGSIRDYTTRPTANVTATWLNPGRNPISPVPTRSIVRIPWTSFSYVSNTLASATLATFQFRANSPYDPDYSIGGQQAAGHTQMASLYGRYKVLASQFELIPLGQFQVMYAMFPNNNATAPTIADAFNQPRAKVAPCGLSGSVTQSKFLKTYCKTSEIVGEDLTDTDLSATVVNNPSTNWFWTVSVYNAYTSVQPTGFIVRMVFTVEYTDPINLAMV